MRLRILFDAFWWYDGPISNRHLMISIIRGWTELYPNDEIVMAMRDSRDSLEGIPSGARVVKTRLFPHGLSCVLELPFIAKRVGADVTFTHNFSPLFGSSLVLIHDVLFLSNPEWFTSKERAYFSLMPLSAGRATKVLSTTASEAVRICEHVRTVSEVTPVGLGIDDRLNGEPVKPQVEVTPNRFLLAVGRLNIRKNLGFTCTAAVRSGAVDKEFPLVVVGPSQGKTDEWSPEVREAIAVGAIIIAGHVTDDELAWLYQNARAFLFMTRGEGFGLPPLEALSAGTEVIASDIPVMREVLGPHATFVSPTESSKLQEVFVQLRNQPEDPGAVAARKEWASTFTWARTIRAIREAAQSAVSSRGRGTQ